MQKNLKVVKIVNWKTITEIWKSWRSGNIRSYGGREITESIIVEVVEGMSIGVIGEFGIGSREPAKTVQSDLREVSIEVGVLRQNHRAPRHEAVYQRLLPRHQNNQWRKQINNSENREREREREKELNICGSWKKGFKVREEKRVWVLLQNLGNGEGNVRENEAQHETLSFPLLGRTTNSDINKL